MVSDARESNLPGIELDQEQDVVDDQPASWQEVFTAMAQAFGTPPPRRLPGWLLRLAAPYVASFVVATSMRVSNAKAKTELGWHPMFPTYHQGIQAMVASAQITTR